MGLCMIPLSGMAESAAFPSRPISLVVPYPPGGPTDLMARTIASALGKSLGGTVIVENKPGGNTIIAASHLAKAPADGHTILLTNDSTYSINPLLYRNLPYDPKADLAPIVAIAHLPEMLIINGDLPIHSLAEFVAYAKANPGKLNYGSFGPGSNPHLAAEGFKAATGIDIVHVPYKGGAPLQQALLSGEVHAMFASPNATLDYIRGGKLRALATYAPERVPQLPDVPTYAEEGFEGLEMNVWFGIFAPSGTPEPILDTLADHIDRLVDDPEFQKERLIPYTFVPAPRGRGYFQTVLENDAARYKKFVDAANVTLD